MSFQESLQKAREEYLFSQSDEGIYQTLLKGVQDQLMDLSSTTGRFLNPSAKPGDRRPETRLHQKILENKKVLFGEDPLEILHFSCSPQKKDRLLKEINLREFLRLQLDTDNFVIRIGRDNVYYYTVSLQLTSVPGETVEYDIAPFVSGSFNSISGY